MIDPIIPVGFDYSKALLDIRRELTYEHIAEICGFHDKVTVYRVVNGDIPRHPQGEAIWALYLKLFGKKPPMPNENAIGAPLEVTPMKRHG